MSIERHITSAANYLNYLFGGGAIKSNAGNVGTDVFLSIISQLKNSKQWDAGRFNGPDLSGEANHMWGLHLPD